MLVAIGVDRMHHQRRLHRIHRAVAGIDALDLARDQAIGDVARIGAAIFFRERNSDQAELTHLMEDIAIDLLLQIGLGDARRELVLRIGARGVADHALVFGELLVEHERIVPLEINRGRLVLGLRAHAHERSFRITAAGVKFKSLMTRLQAVRWRGSQCRNLTVPCTRALTRSDDGWK